MANEPVKPTWMQHADRARAKQAALNVGEDAKRVAAEVREEIAPDGQLPPEQGWLNFAPMPTDLCRVSPFFPMGTKEMAARSFIQELVIAKTAWGEVKYTGPKLSIFEEDVLLAILAILKSVDIEPSGSNTMWVYYGPLRPILTMMGYKKTGKNDYQRVRSALRLLSSAVVEIETKKGRWELANLITKAGGKEEDSTVGVMVNPYFAEMYGAGAVNLLDLATRAQLSRPVSKALHRFATSHRGDWRGHFLTLAAAINLDLSQPQKQIRRQVGQAMTELRKAGVLSARSKFSGDVVTLALASSSAKAVPR